MSGNDQGSKNQIYDSSSGKLSPSTTPQPPAMAYGFQGMRSRLLSLQTPHLGSSGLAGKAIANARKGIPS